MSSAARRDLMDRCLLATGDDGGGADSEAESVTELEAWGWGGVAGL
jgi:hypothetical protein